MSITNRLARLERTQEDAAIKAAVEQLTDAELVALDRATRPGGATSDEERAAMARFRHLFTAAQQGGMVCN